MNKVTSLVKKEGSKRWKLNNWLIFLSVFLGLGPAYLSGQNTNPVNLRVVVEKRFKIEVSSSMVSFMPGFRSVSPQILQAREDSFTLTIKTNCDSGTTVWLVAKSDLVDSSSGITIPINKINWAAEGQGFYPGSLNLASPCLLAKTKGAGIFTGNLNFSFAESPNFAPGSYRANVTILVEGI
ncbi:MAG: hypothetical protein PHU81_00970 [Acidobacteriota bacterium]|nr:hypothetical protein [Acidobacteriota bacterium]